MSHIKHYHLNIIFSAFLSLFVLVGCNDSPSTNETKSKDQDTPAKTESKKSSTTIQIVSPKQYQNEIEKHKGKVVFVDFWATWCINCIKGMRETVELSKEYKKDGLVIIMMCLDENTEEVRIRADKILTKRKITFPSLMAKDGSSDEAYSTYEIEGDALPHYKLIGRDGKLIHAFISDEETGIDHEEVKKKVQAALKK